jgi:hypothetical protein
MCDSDKNIPRLGRDGARSVSTPKHFASTPQHLAWTPQHLAWTPKHLAWTPKHWDDNPLHSVVAHATSINININKRRDEQFKVYSLKGSRFF